MKQKIYYGAICRDDQGFGIVFPDFPGCVTGHDDKAGLLVNAFEALQLHIDAMIADGDDIPEPREYDLADIRKIFGDEEEWTEIVPILVDVAEQMETVPVPMNAQMVSEIGRLVKDSARFLEEAAQRSLDDLKKSA